MTVEEAQNIMTACSTWEPQVLLSPLLMWWWTLARLYTILGNLSKLSLIWHSTWRRNQPIKGWKCPPWLIAVMATQWKSLFAWQKGNSPQAKDFHSFQIRPAFLGFCYCMFVNFYTSPKLLNQLNITTCWEISPNFKEKIIPEALSDALSVHLVNFVKRMDTCKGA